MQRRQFLQSLAATFAAASLPAIAADAAPAKRPNILFCIADDASWMTWGAYGCNWVNTPNFDRVAREGILFRNCFTTNPKCSPSRATLLTGLNTWQLEEACCHFGVFNAKFKVYPDLLEAAGYHVGFTAKGWGPDDFKKGGFKRNPAGEAYNKRTLTPPTKGISRNDYAGNFKDFLDARPKDAPFCFWYGSTEPHRAYEEASGRRAGKKLEDVKVPPYWPDNETVRSDMLDYALELEWFDSHLGRMLKLLEEAGELDNTLIVVTADNGMPFPRIKGQIYEDDFHLPLAIRWGSQLKGGRTVDDFVSFSDMAPTFLEVAGLQPLKEMTGRSFLPVLKSDKSGQVDPARDRIIVGKERHDIGRPGDVGYPVRAIRTKQYLYVRNFEPDRWPAGNPETNYTNIDDSPTKRLLLGLKDTPQARYFDLSMGKRPAEELYDLVKDPACMENLAEKTEFEPVRRKLWEEMRVTLTAQKDPRILGNGVIFDSYEYTGQKSHGWDAVMGKKRACPIIRAVR